MKAAIVAVLLAIVAAADDDKCTADGFCTYTDFIKASNAFGTDLYKDACKKERGNILASPLSLELVLAVTSTGAFGETQKEILHALHVPEDIAKLQAGYKNLLSSIDYSCVTLATQLFIGSEYVIDKRFATQAEGNFQTGVQSVDFSNSPDNAVQTINTFISDKTNGKVKEIVQSGSVDPNTKLLLINTLYFKGKWENPFKAEMTRKGAPFYLTNDKKKTAKADLMYQAGNFKYLNVEELNCQMIEIPFKGNVYKMVILLPNEIEGYTQVESIIKDDPQFFGNFDGFEQRKVELTLPKMKVLVNTDFKETLKTLGVKSVFLQSANLYGIVENDIGKLQVSSVIQKVFLDVDENGAEAAAVTSTSVNQRRGLDDLVFFTADHPFFFAIIQSSNNMVLFQGRYTNP